MVELIHISVKNRLERRMYTGVWRWEAELTVRILSRFPRTAAK